MKQHHSRHLIIDAQVFQTVAWDRGMGKYSFHFLKEFLSQSRGDYTSVKFIFTKHLELATDIEGVLKESFQDVEFIFLDLEVPSGLPGDSLKDVQAHNIEVLDAYIAPDKNSEIDFLILALFIGQACPVFPTKACAILIFYDLIPLQYPQLYADLWSYKDYLDQYSVLFRADKILAISATVANDLAYFTGIGKDVIGVIDGAQIPHEHTAPIKPANFDDGRFVLMVSGNDSRKNNERAIRGFEQYRQRYHDASCRLVITSFFDEQTKQRLSALTKSVEFVGNVSGDELSWLYEHTDAVLFVPEYEGLGLPVLEAVSADKPIVCSDLKLFRDEMSPKAFYFADPYDTNDIAEQLNEALTGKGLAQKKAEYKSVLGKYTWENTAKKAYSFLRKPAKSEIIAKKRLAILVPDPEGYSAIGKVAMLTHYELSQYFEIDYYLEKGRSRQYDSKRFRRPSFLASVANVYDVSQFNAAVYKQYDDVLYHIGNSEFHAHTLKNALHLPGYAVMHDLILTDLFENELERFGYISSERVEAERVLDDLTNAKGRTAFTGSLVASQLGCMVHSRYAKSSLAAENITSTDIIEANLPTAARKSGGQSSHVHQGVLRVGFAGIISAAKGLSLVKRIAKQCGNDVEISVFGITLTDEKIVRDIEAYRNVTVEKNLTDFEFCERLSALDVVVNYREDYHGETSLTVVEAMGHGVVPIVRDVGWYAELPDEVAIKLQDERGVIDSIMLLIADRDKLLTMKQLGALYVERNHTYGAYARSIYTMLKAAKRSNRSARRVHDALMAGSGLDDILKII